MTAQQAAEFLQTSRDTVMRKARAGQLPAAQLGREWRFRRSDLDQWLRQGGTGMSGWWTKASLWRCRTGCGKMMVSGSPWPNW